MSGGPSTSNNKTLVQHDATPLLIPINNFSPLPIQHTFLIGRDDISPDMPDEIGFITDINDDLNFIDDIFDTGRTYAAIIDALVDNCGANLPSDIRLAVPWYKPEKNKTKYTPDYFLHITDKWVVFPHELDVLNDKELAIHRPGIKKLE